MWINSDWEESVDLPPKGDWSSDPGEPSKLATLPWGHRSAPIYSIHCSHNLLRPQWWLNVENSWSWRATPDNTYKRNHNYLILVCWKSWHFQLKNINQTSLFNFVMLNVYIHVYIYIYIYIAGEILFVLNN